LTIETIVWSRILHTFERRTTVTQKEAAKQTETVSYCQVAVVVEVSGVQTNGLSLIQEKPEK
jgi:hypothetical protein